MSLSLASRIKLNDGRLIPIFGLGLYQAVPSAKTTQIIVDALRLGYPLIDTAELYRNEGQVGDALKEARNADEVFITTKILRTNDGRKGLRKSLEKSLSQLRRSFVDLYLIHAPQGGHVLEVYEEMVECQREGKIRSIGVSNFGVQHLEWLRQAGYVPSVNQIELHPWWPNEEIVAYCRSNAIALMGYSPLGKGQFFTDRFLIQLSDKYRRTPAQILLRWSIQNGFITIPKTTSSVERLKENLSIFDFQLSDADLNDLSDYGRTRRENTGWDPTRNSREQFGPVKK